MIAYLIDAKTRRITQFEYRNSRELFSALPGGPCIAATFPNGDVMYVDDEGLLRKATVAFRVRQRPDGQPMMSHGVLTGMDEPDPRSMLTLPPAFTIAELQDEIEWLDLPEALDWFRARAEKPSTTITDSRGNFTVLAHWRDLLRNLKGNS